MLPAIFPRVELLLLILGSEWTFIDAGKPLAFRANAYTQSVCSPGRQHSLACVLAYYD